MRCTHLQRKRVCWRPQATWVTPADSRSRTSVGAALSRKVRVPSWPALLQPHEYTLVSVTATVCCPPAATALTPCARMCRHMSVRYNDRPCLQ